MVMQMYSQKRTGSSDLPLSSEHVSIQVDTIIHIHCIAAMSIVDLFKALRVAIARPKLSGRRSSSTVLNQVCLGLPVLHRRSLEDPECRPEELENCLDWVSAQQRWPKEDRRRRLIVSDKIVFKPYHPHRPTVTNLPGYFLLTHWPQWAI